jgi:vanillate O-demethylase monooxygenase subunit
MPVNSTFSSSDWAVLASHWHPVAYSRDVQDTPYPIRLLDVELVAYRAGGSVVVARDLCIHRGTPLTLGHIKDGEIVCRYHGWHYGPDGRCTLIPSREPGHPIPAKARLMTCPAVERYGIVWACLTDEPRLPLPAWAEAEDPGYRVVYPESQEWASSSGRQVENFLDVSHFSFVHTGTFGNPGWALVPDVKVEPSEAGLRYEFIYMASNPGDSPLTSTETIHRTMHYELTLPFSARLQISYPNDQADVVFITSSPVSARRTRAFLFVARNYDHDKSDEELLAWDLAIFAEDRIIVENQRPEELPLDLSDELHVRADRMTVAYRKALAGLGLGRSYTS